MKIAIVVGHSKDKTGAQGVSPLNTSEYEYNLGIASLLYIEAMRENIKTRIITRNDIGIIGAYKAVTDWTEDDPESACIELHFNSFNGKAKGTETLFDSDPSSSIEFAREIHQAVCLCFSRKGKEDRGLKLTDEGRGAKNLAECKIPGCIIEPFFGDNKDDAVLALNKIQYAKALVTGVKNYFQNKKKLDSLI